MENLSGHFLISTPQMPDPRFQEQVVYLCAHNEEGAMGLVVNNPSREITLLDVLHGAGLPVPEIPLPSVYIGGPVGTDSGFILYTSEETDYASLDVADDVFLSRDMRLLEKIAEGITKVIDKQIDTKSVVRAVFTETQTRKSKTERWENVKNIFEVKHPQNLENKHILLVDDVLTTGSTIEALSNVIEETVPSAKISIATVAVAKKM